MIITDNPVIKKAYDKMVSEGVHPNMAEILAFRSPPGVKSADSMFSGNANGKQFADNPEQGDYLSRELVASGGSTTGKKYMPSLAKHTGDKEAWVSSASDVRRVCEDRGWSCEGAVNVKSDNKPVAEYEPNYPVDPVAVRDKVDHMVIENPEIAPTVKEHKELLNKTMAEMSGHKVGQIKGEM